MTEFGMQALSNTGVEVPEEWGGGTWSAGSSALNFDSVTLIDEDPNGYPYYYTLWDSYRESENTALDIMWQGNMNAGNTMDYLLANDQLMICPGVTYQAPPETSEIATLRSQCNSIIVDYSWKMVFAKDEETFYALQEEMCSSAQSLGYDQVLAEDMKNAKNQSQLREETVLTEQQK